MMLIVRVRIPKETMKDIDRLVRKRKFLNRSDCIRYVVKRYLETRRKGRKA
jgi:Arc/MetJ-type ribon-helix-helix transcriptional regulator